MRLADNILITQAITPTAGVAGVTDIEGAIVDQQNFDDFLAIITFGVITAAAVTGILIQEGDAANLSDAATVTGTSVTVADDEDGTVFAIAVHRTRKRYMRLHVDRLTQNAVVASAEYIQSQPLKGPALTGGVGAGVTSFTKVTPSS